MQATNDAGITPAIGGMNQQDFQEIQLLQGGYPYQKGLQKRFPGKTLQQTFPSPVANIEVFYNALGRPYILTDTNGTIQIDPVVVAPWTLPALPPYGNQWFDDFSGYSPVGLVSLIWGAGVWDISFGICQTLIEGYYDPFGIFPTFAGGIGNNSSLQPKALPPPTVDPAETPATANDPKFQYPVHPPDLFLNVVNAEGDNSCEGQGTSPISAIDIAYFFDFHTAPQSDSIEAINITVGSITVWHGIRIGRMPDVDVGLVEGACPGPPPPVNKSYGVYGNDGSIQELT